MRPGWTKSWRRVSLLAVLLAAGHASPQSKPARRADELTLAGLRPGRDKLKNPPRSFRGLSLASASHGSFVWRDACANRELRVEVDEYGVVQTVSVTAGASSKPPQGCGAGAARPNRLLALRTGRGLLLGDPELRVKELYGPPNTSAPSVRGVRELDLLYYAFDWAGSDVPQVMEVYCDHASGRVVEVTLAAPSL